MSAPLATVTQEFLHGEGPTPGDCLRCSVASLFGMERGDVPHFAALAFDVPDDDPLADAWWYALVGWALYLDPAVLVEAGDPDRWPNPDDEWLAGCYLLSGSSPRGPFNHTVVARAGEVVWDPHPSRAGIVEPVDTFVFTKRDAS